MKKLMILFLFIITIPFLSYNIGLTDCIHYDNAYMRGALNPTIINKFNDHEKQKHLDRITSNLIELKTKKVRTFLFHATRPIVNCALFAGLTYLVGDELYKSAQQIYYPQNITNFTMATAKLLAMYKLSPIIKEIIKAPFAATVEDYRYITFQQKKYLIGLKSLVESNIQPVAKDPMGKNI